MHGPGASQVTGWRQRRTFAWAIALALLVVGAYFPYFRAYVGTDLGVYWEVARRLAESGRLVLGGNYWDHKPPLVYLALAPFTFLEPRGAELLGLKIGALALYLGAGLLVFRALIGLDGEGRRVPRALAAGAAAAFVALVLSARPDAAQNGVLCVAGAACEFAGVVLVVGARGRGAAIVGGALVGSAPFWRPTCVSGLAALAVLTVWDVVESARLKQRVLGSREVRASLSAACAGAFWLGAIVVLGTPLREWWGTIVEMNARYGAYFRARTGVAEYFLQSPALLWWLVGGTAVMAVLGALGARRDRSERTAKVAVTAAVLLGAGVALGVFGRKVQSFYPYQFALPACLGAGLMAAGGPLVSSARWRVAMAVGAWGAAVLTVWASYSVIPPAVWRNAFASNGATDTGVIAGAIAEHPLGRAGGARLWVMGNRANLYQQAALRGVGRYDWTVYDLALLVCDEPVFQSWLARFRDDPPEFIVRLSNAQLAPWEPVERTAARAAAINAVVAERFEPVAVPAATDTNWPHSYQITVLARRPAR